MGTLASSSAVLTRVDGEETMVWKWCSKALYNIQYLINLILYIQTENFYTQLLLLLKLCEHTQCCVIGNVLLFRDILIHRST